MRGIRMLTKRRTRRELLRGGWMVVERFVDVKDSMCLGFDGWRVEGELLTPNKRFEKPSINAPTAPAQ